MKIEIRSMVTLNLSADDWQLYGLEGREQAAYELNRKLEDRINESTSRKGFRYGDLLSQYAAFGASDSEGFSMVEFVLNKVYGREG